MQFRRALLTQNLLILMGYIGILSACNGTEQDPKLRVFAASSLRDVLQEVMGACNLAPDYQFAGSQVLKLQIEHGAKADVYLSANQRHIDTLTAKGLIIDSAVFSHNKLSLVLSPSFDFSGSHLETLLSVNSLVVGLHSAPIGAYTQDWFKTLLRDKDSSYRELIESKIVSYENNTKIVLQRVLQNEADAGIVYQSDARMFPKLQNFPIPDQEQPKIEFYAGIVKRDQSLHPESRLLMACLQSAKALAIFRQYGFEGI